MYKRLFLALFMALSLIVSPLVGSIAQAQSITTLPYANSLVKLDGSSSVYWVATDGKRYVFPTSRTFTTWFSEADFNSVITLSPYQMANIALGGNVTYRPGVRLVKITTDPRVYAVSRYGTLRWITSEALAVQLYGYNWAQQVDDVPDEYFLNYRIGDAIYNTSQFNVAYETGLARSPSDNILSNGSTYPTYPGNPGINGYVTLSVSNSTPTVNSSDATLFTASAINPPLAVQYGSLSIVRADTNEVYRTCQGFSCTFNFTGIASNFAGQTLNFIARLTNTQTGATYESGRISIYPRYNNGTSYNNQATAHTLTFSQSTVRPGENFTVTSRLTPDSTAAPFYTIRIYDQWNVLQHTCYNVRTCVLQQNLSATADTSRTYYASATADNGHTIGSGNATINVIPSINSDTNGRLGASQAGLAYAPNPGYISNSPLTVYTGTTLTISSDLQAPVPTNLTGITIKIYQQDGILLKTCSNANRCAVDKVLSNSSNSTDVTYNFKARVEDAYGSFYETAYAPVIVRPLANTPVTAFSASLTASADSMTVFSNDPITLNGVVSNANSDTSKIGINWYDQDGNLLKACVNSTMCSTTTSYATSNGDRTVKFHFVAWDLSGAKTGTLTSNYIEVLIRK